MFQEEGRAIHSSMLAWRIAWTKDLSGYSPWGPKESDRTEATEHSRTHARSWLCEREYRSQSNNRKQPEYNRGQAVCTRDC